MNHEQIRERASGRCAACDTGLEVRDGEWFCPCCEEQERAAFRECFPELKTPADVHDDLGLDDRYDHGSP